MSNILTAELRWWWRGAAPQEVVQWFERCGPGEIEARCDVYLLTGSKDVGLKRRGSDGGMEVKALVAVCPAGDLPASAELWSKYALTDVELPSAPTLDLAKSRRVVAVAGGAGEGGCDVELSTISATDEAWASLCLEASASLAAPLKSLSSALRLLDPPVQVSSGLLASYPAWLARLARI